MDALLEIMAAGEGPLAYGLLAAGALLEYVFPPFPGDTVVLFGAFLAATAGYHPGLVYLVMTVGSVVGGMGAYFFGRRFEDQERWPRWLRGKRARWAFERIRERFEQYGALYVLANRFIPALRAFVFVAAGASRMPAPRVLLYGTLSSMAWNAIILAVGYFVGANFALLRTLFQRYTVLVLCLLGVLAALLTLRAALAHRRRS